jgi:hypothetical protein
VPREVKHHRKRKEYTLLCLLSDSSLCPSQFSLFRSFSFSRFWHSGSIFVKIPLDCDWIQSIHFHQTAKQGNPVTTLDLLKAKREDILRLAALRGARNLRVFGSVARGEEDSASDVDFIVDMEPGKSLLDLGGLLMDLQELLGRSVDIVTEQGLKARLRDRVLQEAVPL